MLGRTTVGRAVEAAERPAALILYPDATGIQFDERGGADRLSYHVSLKFPAISIIQLIADKLGKGGWEALRYDFMNPNRPSSPLQGWQEFLDGTKKPALCVHQWLGEWKDASGNIVIYAFRYKQPKCSTLALTDIQADGLVHSRGCRAPNPAGLGEVEEGPQP